MRWPICGLLNQPHSDQAFERVVNVPTRGIGDKSVERIRALARSKETSLWQAAKEGVAEGAFSGRATNAILAFIQLIETMAAEVAGLALHEIAENLHRRERPARLPHA